jgi:exosortase
VASAQVKAPWKPHTPEIVAVVAVLAALGGAYASSFYELGFQWNRDPNYSYGFFVIPIAAVIFWSRSDRLDRAQMYPQWWALLPLLVIVALRFPLFEWNEQYIETATIPLVVAALALALGGWHLLRVAAPAIVFLFFMLPLPPSINVLLARPLQTMATIGSVALLQLLGFPVMAEGNVIIIGATPLEVARACNGLSMLLSFVTLICAVVILIPRPAFERFILLVSAIPIAIISNILRITATAIAYHYLGEELGEKIAHNAAGWAMMPIGLVLVWIELTIMGWLFIEVEEVDAGALLRRRRGGKKPTPDLT